MYLDRNFGLRLLPSVLLSS